MDPRPRRKPVPGWIREHPLHTYPLTHPQAWGELIQLPLPCFPHILSHTAPPRSSFRLTYEHRFCFHFVFFVQSSLFWAIVLFFSVFTTHCSLLMWQFHWFSYAVVPHFFIDVNVMQNHKHLLYVDFRIFEGIFKWVCTTNCRFDIFYHHPPVQYLITHAFRPSMKKKKKSLHDNRLCSCCCPMQQKNNFGTSFKNSSQIVKL